MSGFTILVSVLLLISSVAIIVVVLLQEGHSQNLSGAISGGADSFLSKGTARTLDKFLAKWTKVIAIGFFLLTILCDVIAVL